jgi:hypothetical protein
MPRVGFEHRVIVFQWTEKIHALHRAVNMIGLEAS